MKSIICFGDSITFGRFDNSNGGWVGRLKKYYENKSVYNIVYNLGIPGDNSRTLKERINVECSSRAKYVWEGDEHLIIIAIGINDSRGVDSKDNLDIPLEEFKENILEIINSSKKNSKKILVLSTTPVVEKITNPFENTYFINERIKEYNNILKVECEKNNLLFLDLFGLMIKEDYQKMLADGLHPNSAGYDFMFQKIKKFIEEKELI